MKNESLKFDKDYYSIGEVANLLGLQTSVIRYWNSMFSKYIKPMRRSQRRYFTVKDILLLEYIKEQLYQHGVTIKGVRKLLDERFLHNVNNDVVASDTSSLGNQIDQLIIQRHNHNAHSSNDHKMLNQCHNHNQELKQQVILYLENIIKRLDNS